MPSRSTHDHLTQMGAIAIAPISLIGYSLAVHQPRADLFVWQVAAATAITITACIIGGVWLSPDVDVKGYLKRWGLFRILWLPYYKLCHLGGHYRVNGKATHRSHLSHSPIIGSVSRLLYILVVTSPVFYRLWWETCLYLKAHPIYGIAVLVGLELANLIHICSDWVWSELK